MRRMLWCGLAVLLGTRGLGAQSVPARDLWEFPLGAVLEPAALAMEPGSGLWNPAALRVPAGARWNLGVASLTTSAEQAVDGQMVMMGYRRESGVTWGLSVARATVPGILRTDTDPQSLGEVPYNSLLASVTASRELLPHLTAGMALRYREGRADRSVNHAVAADLGVVLHDLPFRDARLSVASFLWRPGQEIIDRPAVVAAADLRLMGTALRETRVGISYNGVHRGAREYGPFVAWRIARVDLRGAWLRTTSAGGAVTRLRSGIALHYTRFVVGVAREEGVSGLGPLYQFTLSSLLK